MTRAAFCSWLVKQAAVPHITGRSQTVPMAQAATALRAESPPAAHQAPTRYGRKPYKRLERTSS